MKNKIIFLLVLILASCGNQYQEESQRFQKVIHEIDNKQVSSQKNIKVFLVIPNAGCIGCISSAEAFVLTNIDASDDLVVIFTSFKSRKALKLKLGTDIFNHSRVLIDSKEEVYRQGFSSIYPIIYYMKNEQIVDIKEARPDNSTNIFQELMEKLNTI